MSASIACVLLNYKFPQDTLACLRSLRDSGKDAFKIFLVNNFAADGSGAVLKRGLEECGMAYAYFEPASNLGYTGGMNLGMGKALEEGFASVLMLNNDTVVGPDFAAEALAAIRAHPDDVVAGTVLDADTGEPSFNIGRITKWTCQLENLFVLDPGDPIDFVSGCLMLAPASVLRRVGLFDDRYFMYREDFDFCLRLKAQGVRVAHWPSLVVRHKVSSATDKTGTPKEYYRMRNQTHIILHRASLMQKVCYAMYLSVLLAYKARHPAVLRQFVAGVRDALRGRLGPR